MTPERLAEIRIRHALDEEERKMVSAKPFAPFLAGYQEHGHRAELLAEVDRLRDALQDIAAGTSFLEIHEILAGREKR